jgi:hypothetical protein
MSMRRNGAACETAQRLEPLLGLTARFSAERQKFCSATPWSDSLNASTVMSPLMTTPPGFWPRPATEV